MADNRPGVADIFRQAGPAFRARFEGALDAVALKIMDCIASCRTPALGGTVYQCSDCGHAHGVWKSCGNRHCPSCQGAAARKWMEKQAACILPVPYFHIVFTLPRPIARIALQNRGTVFNILFRTAAETLKTISADPRRFGAGIGGTAVLHTWNQKMDWHPHLHCLVPNGGFDVGTEQWKAGSDSFFAPVKVLASFFRRRVLEELAKAHARQELEFHGSIAHLACPRAFARVLKQARKLNWNVHARPPFNGPAAVIRYLSRYTHRIAISDARILSLDDDAVTFRCRRPTAKAGDKPSYGTMALSVDEFIRRFLMHRLPAGFHRIRHFGILANACRARTLEAVPEAGRHQPPHAAGDETGTGETDRPEAPACPNCGKPSWPVLTIRRKPTDREVARAMEIIRKRGHPRPHETT